VIAASAIGRFASLFDGLVRASCSTKRSNGSLNATCAKVSTATIATSALVHDRLLVSHRVGAAKRLATLARAP